MVGSHVSMLIQRTEKIVKGITPFLMVMIRLGQVVEVLMGTIGIMMYFSVHTY